MAKKFRIAALGDLHVTTTSLGQYKKLFEDVSKKADVLLLCGDLTDYGLPEEAKVLRRELASCTIPQVAVLGNHDYESGQQDAVREILPGGNTKVLDGESCEIKGIGFAGVKGFCGGFDSYMLQPWGEDALKAFVKESVREAEKLEGALAKLDTDRKIVLLHYAPITETVIGEPEPIYPFLGSSRLADPIDRHNVSLVFHGHAHHGTHKGNTIKGIPVYNVSRPVMEKINPAHPFALVEI